MICSVSMIFLDGTGGKGRREPQNERQQPSCIFLVALLFAYRYFSSYWATLFFNTMMTVEIFFFDHVEKRRRAPSLTISSSATFVVKTR